MTTTTTDFIQMLREEIKRDIRDEVLSELTPVIEKLLHNNVFDIEQAVKYLKISQSTIRRMANAEEIPYFRQRGQLFFRQVDLDAWIQGKMIRARGGWEKIPPERIRQPAARRG